MNEKENKKVPNWLRVASYVVVAVIAMASGYLTLKNDLIPNFDKWLLPVTENERPKQVEKPTIDSLLTAINDVRQKAGVQPLRIDQRLNKSAQIKANDMKKRNYFAHADPDGKQGYEIAHEYMPECVQTGENMTDSGVESDNTTEAGVKAWVNSPSHYADIVNPEWLLTGFGITSTGLVEHFCKV